MNKKSVYLNGVKIECNEKTTFNELFENLEKKDGEFGQYFWGIKGKQQQFPEQPKKNHKLSNSQPFKDSGSELWLTCDYLGGSPIQIKEGTYSTPKTTGSSQNEITSLLPPSQINPRVRVPLQPPPIYPVYEPRDPNQRSSSHKQIGRQYKKAPTISSEIVSPPIKDVFQVTIKEEASVVELNKLNGEFRLVLKEKDASENDQQRIQAKLKQIQQINQGQNLISLPQNDNKNVATKVWFGDDHSCLIVEWFSGLYSIVYIRIN